MNEVASHVSITDNNAYVFGRYRLVPKRQSLTRGGVAVKIGGRALDILTILTSRAGEIVTKKDLMEFGWPGIFVHEANLKVNIASLRRVLSECQDGPQIATIAGRGYRFVSPVVIETDGDVLLPQSTGTRSLPRSSTVIGREEEIEAIVQMLSGTRCLTIVGPGGVGKTTVAVEVAKQVSADYPGGVFFIDLSTVGDPQYAITAVGAGLGVQKRSEDPLLSIVDMFRDRRALVIFDNCEHLLPVVASIASHLLAGTTELVLLATSREPLRATLERIYRLPTLTVPSPGSQLTVDEAMQFGAVQLFVARAGKRGAYALSAAEASLVSAICRRLDGIALAIELAASKAIALGLPALADMIEKRLVLSNGQRLAPLRQQTLFATIDWSYRLLTDNEAAMLRLLSVFRGAFSLRDAVAMAQLVELDVQQSIDAIERLVHRSLVVSEYRDGVIRYRLLDTTREYAMERLVDAAEGERSIQHYVRHVLSLFEQAADEAVWREKRPWMADYHDRIDDLRNALAWAFGPSGDRALGVQLTAAAIPLWREMSLISEMHSRVERALLAVRELGPVAPELTMKLLAGRATGMSFAQHLPATEAAWEECYRLGKALDNPSYQMHGLWGLSSHMIFTGRLLKGIALLEEFLVVAERQGDWSAMAEGNRSLAMAEAYNGNIGRARERLERLGVQNPQPSDPIHFVRFQAEKVVALRCSYAFVLWVAGDCENALKVAGSAIERAEATGHVVSHANALAGTAIPLSFWASDFAAVDRFLAVLEEDGRQENIGIWREICLFFRYALAWKRNVPGSAHHMQASLEAMMAAGTFIVRAPRYYSMIAEAYMNEGMLAEAREIADKAHKLALEQLTHWSIPDILLVKGMLNLKAGVETDAKEAIEQALRKAEDMGAKEVSTRAVQILLEMSVPLGDMVA